MLQHQSRKIRISLRLRIFTIFLGILAASVVIFILSFYRFVSKTTYENLDKEYLGMVNDLSDTSQNLLWKLTLTSQQLLENEGIQDAIVHYQESSNPYQRQTYYSDLLNLVSSYTMADTDVALLYFYDPKTQDIIYSSLPVDQPQSMDQCLYQNDLFSYEGPASSQSNILSNPVFILDRPFLLPNNRQILFSVESGYYSLDRQFQALAQKSAYAVFCNGQGQILYNSMPDSLLQNVDIHQLLLGKNPDFHVFSQQASQGWYTYIIVPKSVYLSQYQNGLLTFSKYILIFAVILLFFAFTFWRSIDCPLQLFDRQLESIVTGREVSGENPSSIPEFDLLFRKIKFLQQQVQKMLEQAVVQERANTKSQLEKLRAQINPHFLMNTLNTIHWLALMNKQPEIDSITQSLAHLLSYNLDKDSYHTNLQRELDAVSEYVRLQKVRYQFEYHMQILPEDSALNYPCPKFILQPFIENALTHGYRENMKITISVSAQENEALITIADTGAGMSHNQLEAVRELLAPAVSSGADVPFRGFPSSSSSGFSPSGSSSCKESSEERVRPATPASGETSVVMNRSSGKGIGLSYVAGILRLYYKEPCRITAESEPEHGTTFCIHLPKLKGRGYNAENTDH